MPQRRTARVRGKGTLALASEIAGIDVDALVGNAQYQGSPYHCAHSPSGYMPNKTKCPPHVNDEQALGLLQQGLRLRMFSSELRSNWPRRVWAVDDDGQAYEARLTHSSTGEYHGFPLGREDKFAEYINNEWGQRINEQP